MLDAQRKAGGLNTPEVYRMCEALEIPRETARSNIKRYKKHYRMTNT